MDITKKPSELGTEIDILNGFCATVGCGVSHIDLTYIHSEEFLMELPRLLCPNCQTPLAFGTSTHLSAQSYEAAQARAGRKNRRSQPAIAP